MRSPVTEHAPERTAKMKFFTHALSSNTYLQTPTYMPFDARLIPNFHHTFLGFGLAVGSRNPVAFRYENLGTKKYHARARYDIAEFALGERTYVITYIQYARTHPASMRGVD